MGLLDDLAGKALGTLKTPGNSNADMLGSVMGTLLSKETGGLAGLVETFTKKGLGDIVSSWVGTGSNLPVTSEQVHNVLGSDQVRSLAAKAGISPELMTSKLSELLPQVVDKMTPEGRVPSDDLIQQGLDFLKGKF